jgi:hypothetical protein
MKNIHVLPTDKASRLWLDSDNKLWIHEIPTTLFMMQNIYITSDEKIEEGDWLLIIDDFETYIHKHKGDNLPTTYYKKIILTTDQDLIKDGVQSIDDEFLEWFVKNPSCEKVETICGLFNPMGRQVDPNNLGQNHSQCIWKHKIIIPQEEPKQHLDYINNNIEEFEGKLKEFKQASEHYAHNHFNMHETNNYKALKQGYEAGAKEMFDKMYSEEEVRKLLETQRGNCAVAILIKTRDEELAAIAGGAPEPSGYNGWVK